MDVNETQLLTHERNTFSDNESSNTTDNNNKTKSNDSKRNKQNKFTTFFAKNFFMKGPPTKNTNDINDDDSNERSNSNNNSNNNFESIKVKVKGTTRVGEMKDLRLGQCLMNAHKGAIYCMEFSKKGDYLATAGQDSILRIWTIVGSTSDSLRWDPNIQRKKPSKNNNNNNNNINSNINNIKDNNNNKIKNDKKILEDAPNSNDIINSVCFREFTGHRAPIIDISWSNGEFILTASIDQTVMLWHTWRSRCLCLFQHADIVTSVQFHPIQDYLFISGSFDSRLRLWNILEHRVVDWVQVPTLVTASTFSPNGKYVVAGLYDGQCFFYKTEGMRLSYDTVIECRNANGKYKKGTKVTGLQYRPINSDDNNSNDIINNNNHSNNNNGNTKHKHNNIKKNRTEHGCSELLISTNDSRIRLINISNFDTKCKYKGHTNTQSQIDARFSPNGNLLISGSEDGNVYIWRYKRHINDENSAYMKLKKNRNEYYESFKPKNIINNNNGNIKLIDSNNNNENITSSSNLSTKESSNNHINNNNDNNNNNNSNNNSQRIQQVALFSRHRTIHYVTKFRKYYNPLIHINEDPPIKKNDNNGNLIRNVKNYNDKIRHIIITGDTDGNIMVFTNHSNNENYVYPYHSNMNKFTKTYMKTKSKRRSNTVI